jgi:hypothetical protein
MSDIYDRTRLLVAKREDEDSTMIVAAMPESTWEIIPPEEWDELMRKRAREFFDDDWTAYDYMEIVVTILQSELLAIFKAREIRPSCVEAAVDQPKMAGEDPGHGT